MKLRDGIPTKKFIRDLADKHDLIIHYMDSYCRTGSVTYGYRKNANAKAALIAEELRGYGLKVECRAADQSLALTGAITIIRKDK